MRVSFHRVLTVWLAAVAMVASAQAAEKKADKPVSYYKQVRPILQAQCQGCHQPAKPKGGYVMTDYVKLLAGGDSEGKAIVPKSVTESALIRQITPKDGKAEMPKGSKPLHEVEIELISKWIAEGAIDDTPENAKARYDMENPPVYTRSPVVTALDFSSDGQYLAVAGFHEVLLHKADGSGLVARLVGLSERIEAVRFSPDGKKLAVTGGLPGRMGEVQVWDVEKRKLDVSVPVTFDTVYGAAWSPDGKLISFGCTDKSVRAIEAATGKQVLFQGSHDDWIEDTVFSLKGDHVISVGRDRTAKLTELATQRFIDNITSITPGALRGGISAVARHPSKDEILMGGADGVPQIFRVFRETKRVIGDNSNLIRKFPAMEGRIFAVDYNSDGKRIVASSSMDGSGEVNVYAADIDGTLNNDLKTIFEKVASSRSAEENKKVEEFQTKDVKLIASTKLKGGIYAVVFSPNDKVIAAAGTDGDIHLLDAQTLSPVKTFEPAPLEGAKLASGRKGKSAPRKEPDYIVDVTPVLSKMGCNMGTCHGAKDGKNGFKLSLRGYDPVFDLRAFADDLASRRVNLASPDDSLILLKATGAVPHEGGQRTKQGDKYYQIVRDWIAAGAKVNFDSPKVARIELTPKNPVVNKVGDTEKMKVIAFYTDGSKRDVSNEAFIESGNVDIIKADEKGVVTTLRRGEAPVLARYEGAYAATTITVMGDRSGFKWKNQPTYSEVDELVEAKWKRMKILPSELCTDDEFVRRVHLDLTGLPPTADDIRKFTADNRDPQLKREELVDQLISSADFIEHWSNKWADLLQVNSKFLGAEGAKGFRDWIRKEVAANTPYDQFVNKILTASGSNKENPPASYYKILRTPAETMENTTHLFLATRFNCNKCHDHPFERWTQDQYYQMTAYFAQVDLKNDPAAGDKKIGGTAVEGAKPLYEIVYDKKEGEIKHDRTGKVTAPQFPYTATATVKPDATRREQLAAWITAKDNRYFAMSYVNRMWGYLTGTGIIEPIDDIRAGNPPTNPELLDYLTKEFIAKGFDTQYLMRTICKSRTYQLSVRSQKWNNDDTINYSHAKARRLPAEVLFDSIYLVTGSQSKIPGAPVGARAASLTDSALATTDGFLANLGKPSRESSCECERSGELQLGPIMALVSGPTVGNALNDPQNAITKLIETEKDNHKVVNELFMRILNRPASEKETARADEAFQIVEPQHKQLVAELAAYEIQLKPITEKREQDRVRAVADAKTELAAYQKEIAPREAEADQKQKDLIAQREKELKEHEVKLVEKQAEWEKDPKAETAWVALKAKTLKASVNGIKLVQQDDLSILSSGNDGKGNYVITAETDLKGITAFKLEALVDSRLPKSGPGRSADGNFVLTEFEVKAGPTAKPAEAKAVVLANAKADFSQASYDVKTAIDGKRPAADNGWAIAAQQGQNHVATFEVKETVGAEGGTILTFTLDQQYNSGQHNLGRFRLSATTSKKPVSFGVSEDIQKILEVVAEQRTEEQKKKLTAHYRSLDAELQKRTAALAEAKKPRPIDPKLKDLQDVLARAEQPLLIDPKLADLKRAVELSTKQVQQLRLVAAQDIAWALINNPAFLFNR